MLTPLLLSAILALVPPAAARPFERVRPMTAAAAEVLAEAARRSPTIARLLKIVEQSDAIVYIDLDLNLRGEGATALIGVNDQARFIRVAIDMRLATRRRIEMLGHELQHAVEIIENGVRDADSMRRLFSRIGWVLGDSSFESGGAIGIERSVRRDLRVSTLKKD
jgi:hypothetical protein